jgi:AcrR family transcriptional regulator
MAKAGRKPQLARGEMRDRVVNAAFDTLRTEGFTGTSARAIARTGGFDQGLVFYYFGSVTDLLLAALAHSSTLQLAQYEAALGGVETLPELLRVVAERFDDDMASGHIKVLAELVGASAADAHLAEGVGTLVQPWLRLTEETVNGVLTASGLGGFVPGDQLAFAVVALFLGVELLVNLTGDDTKVHALFETGSGIAALLSRVLTGPSGGVATR